MKRPSAVVWQEFRDRVAAFGGQVVEPEWLGINTPHRVVCKFGHQVTPTPARLERGGGLCRACAGKDPDTAWQAFRHRVAELGGSMTEREWLGCQTPHRVICKEGHEATPRPNDVQQGGGLCRICAGNDTSAAEKAFRQRVAELGGHIVEPEWLGTKKSHRVICAQGHQAQPRPNDVLAGHGLCLTCAGKDPAVTEKAFRDAIARLGGQIAEPTWLGVRKPHRIVCPNGHEVVVYPAAVARGGEVCPVCAGRAPGMAWQAFRERVAELGGHVIEPEWLGNAVGHRVVCREGHECAPLPAGVQQGQGICRVCAGIDSATAWRNFLNRVAELGGRVVEVKWLGSDTPHRVVCREGHATTVRPGGVRGGQGLCRFCKCKVWDIFYVVVNDAAQVVKFGVTSHDPRDRLRFHWKDGFDRIVRTMTNRPDALEIERAALATLHLAGVLPVRGREYYDLSALPVILDIADNWPTPAAA